MKISTEQIREIFVRNGFKLSNETGDDLKQYVYSAARELIALAQQIKPLEWVEVSDALKVVKTICGEYAVFNSITVVSAKFADDEYYSRLFQTEAEAIEAANADYRKRVLSCLVNGGE